MAKNTMTENDFNEFDRTLEDFRNSVVIANMTMRKSVDRYIAMMDTLNVAFLLFYSDMPIEEQIKMKDAFDKLAGTVSYYEEPTVSNVPRIHTLFKESSKNRK